MRLPLPLLLALVIVFTTSCGKQAKDPLAHLGPWGGAPNSTEAPAVEAIRSRGGTVYVDESVPEHPAVKVAVGRDATNADLVQVGALLHLRKLYISAPAITDDGLQPLERLVDLETLELPRGITDQGLAHLKGMRGLKTLTLNYTQVTDAGLKHVKEMPGLAVVYVWQSRVTDKGIEDLRNARPRLEVLNSP